MYMDVFRYNDFVGSIKMSFEDKCLYGNILYINDLMTYQIQHENKRT